MPQIDWGVFMGYVQKLADRIRRRYMAEALVLGLVVLIGGTIVLTIAR